MNDHDYANSILFIKVMVTLAVILQIFNLIDRGWWIFP